LNALGLELLLSYKKTRKRGGGGRGGEGGGKGGGGEKSHNLIIDFFILVHLYCKSVKKRGGKGKTNVQSTCAFNFVREKRRGREKEKEGKHVILY